MKKILTSSFSISLGISFVLFLISLFYFKENIFKDLYNDMSKKQFFEYVSNTSTILLIGIIHISFSIFILPKFKIIENEKLFYDWIDLRNTVSATIVTFLVWSLCIYIGIQGFRETIFIYLITYAIYCLFFIYKILYYSLLSFKIPNIPNNEN